MNRAIYILLIFFSFEVTGQINPGYMGKTHALGFHVNIGPLSKNLIYPTYCLKFEQTINETSSIELSAGCFKNSFKPNDYLESDYTLRFGEGGPASFENHNVLNIKGEVAYSGIQCQIGFVKYLKIFGGMAPYGKRLSIGYFNNGSKISAQDNTYSLFKHNWGNTTDEYEYTTGKNAIYKYKNMSGFFVEIGEKKIVKDILFFQYSAQVNLPLTTNYAKNEVNNVYYNYQDMYENIMRKSIFNNNILSLYFGVGLLIK